MAGVTITSATRTGTAVVVKGTATAGPVTVDLLEDGEVVDTKDVDPDKNGNWEATFDPAPQASRARATVPGGKEAEVPIT